MERVWKAVEHWYGGGMHPSIQICLRVDGEVVLDRAIGTTPETPSCVFSAAKGITTTVFHLLAEQRVIDLDDPVCKYLPSYTSHGKDRTTIRHVLTHRAGVPFMPGVAVTKLSDSEQTVAALARLKPVHRPGRATIYHAVTFGLLTREIVYAATGKTIRDVLATEILDPNGFRWTNYGVAQADVAAVAPAHVTGSAIPAAFAPIAKKLLNVSFADMVRVANDERFLTGVLPSSNTVSTAQELSRFYELLLHGRILQPETLRRALVPSMRMRPELSSGLKPIRWGQGYLLGGDRFSPFGKGTPQAFGNPGVSEVLGWADPQRRLAGAIVSSGKPFKQPHPDRYPNLLNTIAAALN